MKFRIAVFISLLLVLLAACVPAPLETTPTPAPASPAEVRSIAATSIHATGVHLTEVSPTRSSAAAQPEAAQPEETQPAEDESALLVAPTLAPTATPGLLYSAVSQVVEATNLEDTSFLGLFVADWINLAISLLLVLLTITLLARLIFLILRKIARRTATPYDERYLELIHPYLRWLFGVIILSIATDRLQFLSPAFKQWLGQFYFVAIVVLITLCLWRLMDVFVLWYQDKTKDQGERESKEAVLMLGERAVRALLVMVGIIIILDHVGFNVAALVTALGIGGLAISLAAQDTIANMISGVIILVDQPFRSGDRIEIQELNTWGDVVSIGLRSTRIRTLDNRLVIVPNARISQNQVVNYTYPDPRYRIQTELGVAYGTDLRVARQVITDALYQVEGVLPDKPVDILFLEFGDSAMILRVRWWIQSYIDARRSTDRVNEAMVKALEQAGIELPNQQMTINLHSRESRDSDLPERDAPPAKD